MDREELLEHKRIPFNVNHYVWVKLTDKGRETLKKAHIESYGDRIEYTPPKEVDGWSEWQLWVLMNEIGAHLYNGCDLLMETEIQFSAPDVVLEALKGLDEWESIDTAPEEKWVLCYRDGAIFFAIKTINGRVWMKKRKSRESLKALEKDPTHWKPITPPKDMGGAK